MQRFIYLFLLQVQEVLLKRSARRSQTPNVSAVENLLGATVIIPLANVTLDLDWVLEVQRWITQLHPICQSNCLFNDSSFFLARMFKMCRWIFQHIYRLVLSKMERVCPLLSRIFQNMYYIKNVISAMFLVVACYLQLCPVSFILDANQQESVSMEPRPQMSSVIRSHRVTLMSLQPPHQTKMFLSLLAWYPTVHMRGPKLRRRTLPPPPHQLRDPPSPQRTKDSLPTLQTQATTSVRHLLMTQPLIPKEYEITCSLLVLFRYGPPHIWNHWTACTDRRDLQAAPDSPHGETTSSTKYVAEYLKGIVRHFGK